MRRTMIGLLLVAGPVGCTPAPPPPPVVVPTIPTPSTTAAPTTTTPVPTVPSSCAQLVPGDQLDTVLGAPVSGVVRVVRGQAIPDIGRTARTTCSYGDATPDGISPLEISLTSYTTAAEASERVTVTVAAGERQGVGSTRIPAGGTDGLYIPLPDGGLLVASSGIFSVAVTVAPSIAPPPEAGPRAAAVAAVVLAGVGV